jgi:ERCC4-type nuclease
MKTGIIKLVYSASIMSYEKICGGGENSTEKIKYFISKENHQNNGSH